MPFGKLLKKAGKSVKKTGDSLTGKSAKEAAKKAARSQKNFNDAALAEQRRQFDITYAQQKPFIDAGLSMLPDLARGATAEGFGQNLQDIMDNSQVSDIRNSIISQEMGGINRDLSALGNLSYNEGLAIDDLLTNRKQSLAGRGQTAATNAAQFGQNQANSIANLLADTGAAQAKGIMGQQSANALGTQNAVNLMAGLSSYFR